MDIDFLKIGERISLGMMAATRAIPGTDRIITFRASTDGLDRHGTKIMPMGINLDKYNQNPICLFGHDGYGGWSTPDPENIIGRSDALRKSETSLEVDMDFLEAAVNPRADMIYRMIKAGALNAVSVGIIPREVRVEVDDAGREIPVITKCDLLEISVVPIPSNPDAVAISREFTAFQRAAGGPSNVIDAAQIRDAIMPELLTGLKNNTGGIRERLGEIINEIKASMEAEAAETLAKAKAKKEKEDMGDEEDSSGPDYEAAKAKKAADELASDKGAKGITPPANAADLGVGSKAVDESTIRSAFAQTRLRLEIRELVRKH